MRIAKITTATAFLLAAPLLATSAVTAAAQDQPMAKPCTDTTRTDCNRHDYNGSQDYKRNQGNYGGQDENTRPDNYGHQDNNNNNANDHQNYGDRNNNRDYNADREQNHYSDHRSQARYDEDRMRGRYGWGGHAYYWHGRHYHSRLRCRDYDRDSGWCYR